MKSFVSFLVQQRIVLLIIAVVIAIVCWPYSQKLQMDRRLEKMLVDSDPDVVGYVQLQKQFAASDVVLMIYRDEQLWSESGVGLKRMEQIGTKLRQVPGVQAILSLAELNKVLKTLRGARWLSPADTPVILAKEDALAIRLRELFSGYTHKEGSPVAAIACMLQPVSAASVSRDDTLSKIQQIAKELPDGLSSGELLGEPVMVHDGFQLLEADGARLGITASVILAIVLLILFRSIRWMLVPLIVVHWSLLVTRGLLVIVGGELSMVSSMLTAIVTVVGVATVIHLLLEFQQQLRHCSPVFAMQCTLQVMVKPIFWAILTTSAGFAALILARVGPVQDFGWIMSLAVLVTGIATFLLVPGLALVGSFDTIPNEIPGDAWLRYASEKLYEMALRWRVLSLAILVILTIAAFIGSYRLQVETDFITSFRADSPLVKAYRTVEQNLGGAGVWDIVVPAPATLTDRYLKDLLELEKRLQAISVIDRQDSGQSKAAQDSAKNAVALTKVISVADAVYAADADRWLTFLPVGAKLEGMRQTMPEFMSAMLTDPEPNSEQRFVRIMLRSPESASSSAKSMLISKVKETVKEFTARPEWQSHFKSGEKISGYVTGYYLLLAKLVESLLADQWICFLVATVCIGLMLWIALGDWWLALASLVPNMLPIFLVWGIMGWLGYRVDMGAVMIAAVSIGLSIDGSIHYLLRAQREEVPDSELCELNLVVSVSKAASETQPTQQDSATVALTESVLSQRRDRQLRAAQRSTGVALMVATLALVLGFLSLAVSDFRPTVTFGTLVSLTMIGGLVGNLVILPILVAPWKPRRTTSRI